MLMLLEMVDHLAISVHTNIVGKEARKLIIQCSSNGDHGGVGFQPVNVTQKPASHFLFKLFRSSLNPSKKLLWNFI